LVNMVTESSMVTVKSLTVGAWNGLDVARPNAKR